MKASTQVSRPGIGRPRKNINVHCEAYKRYTLTKSMNMLEKDDTMKLNCSRRKTKYSKIKSRIHKREAYPRKHTMLNQSFPEQPETTYS
ncbi:unnamed protein product [Acanthoscelides obtectus]|uniref:Uncharacterized protein n=1 Tax=Acanthoscelides obtectus TaxID=200917 RepID=A0A9P0KHR7_ACAOB|nr:unnamed protein product [Acanthoscelides obtectus]CAK1635776.1 hypothetical protein AOBTE_LOCUS9492 [Acanthoscelides obtectus]